MSQGVTMKDSTKIAKLIIVLITTMVCLQATPAAADENSVVQPAPDYASRHHISYSGDDDYDPAAGGQPLFVPTHASSYSGDDAYDPAAERHAKLIRALASSYSGDDAYDPAAGGLYEPLATKYGTIQR